jgi:hypothetical protein
MSAGRVTISEIWDEAGERVLVGGELVLVAFQYQCGACGAFGEVVTRAEAEAWVEAHVAVCTRGGVRA